MTEGDQPAAAGNAEDESLHDKFVRANHRNLNNPLIAAFEVALRLGQWVVGSEHVFAALLSGKPDSEAAEIMRSLGMEAAAFENELRRHDERRPSERAQEEFLAERRRIATQGQSLRSSPAYSRLDGLSQGFSASRHEGSATSIDYLLAFLWSGSHSLWPYELQARDITPEVVAAELKNRGTSLPVARLPEPVRAISIVKISSGAVAKVVDILSRKHPEGSGINWRLEVRSENATVFADPRINIDDVLREAGTEAIERPI